MLDRDTEEYLSETFEGVDLAGRGLTRKRFEACHFIACDFSEGRFEKCEFIDCRFSQCNLSLVELAFSRFSEVNFAGCKLLGINWCRASWPQLALSAPINFSDCLLNDSSFFGLSLSGLVMTGCRAHDVDFREGNFSGGQFAGTDFSNSLFGNTRLAKADFVDATHYDLDVRNNNVQQARFDRFEAVRLLSSLGICIVD